MLIHNNLKMADLILLNYQLLPIINRFGINLGFGEQTVQQICEQNKININFFLEIVNAFHDKKYFPDKNLQKFSIQLIINYLSKTHEFFTEVKLLAIENMINQLINNYKCQNRQKIALIKNFFLEYKKEFILHVEYENNTVYPYVLLVENAFISQTKENIRKIRQNNYSIEKYANEHSDVQAKLFDLKNILIKYLPQPYETNLCNHILFDIFELETDLFNHQRIEEKVLIPKIYAMENKLKIEN